MENSEPSTQANARPTDGAQLIVNERKRQIEHEGWSSVHDEKHARGELSHAAAAYLEFYYFKLSVTAMPIMWPWSRKWWKPSPDPVRNLVKAGALIAAEIDRIQKRGS